MNPSDAPSAHTPDSEQASDLDQLEAAVRRIEARAPKSVAYDTALAQLYIAYAQDGLHAEAADTLRKLWQLREKELGASNKATIEAAVELGGLLTREEASWDEAGRLLDQALARLSRLPKREAATELRALWLKAELLHIAQPQAPSGELEVLELLTRVIERNVKLVTYDAMRAHRLRVKELRGRIGDGDASMRQRALAIGRKAWIAHEALAIETWEAYRKASRAWTGTRPHPIEDLTEFYTEDVVGETGGLRLPAFTFSLGSTTVVDDAVAANVRAARILEILPRAVEAELKLSGGTGGDVLLKPLAAIVEAAREVGNAPVAREKLARAGKLLVDIEAKLSGRYSDDYLSALQRVVDAYDMVAPGTAGELTAERDTVRRILEAEQLVSEALSPRSPKLRGALDGYIRALGKGDGRFVEFLTSGHSGDERPDPDTLIEAMDHLFELQGPTSPLAFELANRILDRLVEHGREYDAFRFGARIARKAEQDLGPSAPATQAIVTHMLSPALKFASDAERRDWLAKSRRMEAAPSDRLIQGLLARGESAAALGMVWRKVKAAQARRRPNADYTSTPFTAAVDNGYLTPTDYELISVLGEQSDLAAFATIVEKGITQLLTDPTAAKGSPERTDWLSNLFAGILRVDEQDAQHMRSLRSSLLGYPKALRGDCDAGIKARDELAAARQAWLKRNKRGIDLNYTTMFGIEAQIERAAMDCLVRGGRLRDATRLIKTSKLAAPTAQAAELRGNIVEVMRTMMAWGAVSRLPASAVTDLRATLVLASASDWVGTESRLRSLVEARQENPDYAPQERRKEDRPPSASFPEKTDTWVFDTLAALKYAPGKRPSELIAATYLKALWHTKGAAAGREDVDRAFQLAQRSELGPAVAIARMAARGLGGPELATKVRRLQDLEEEEARLPLSDLSDISGRLRKIAEERADVEAEIAQKFPRYFEQIKPRTIGLAEVQKLLTGDEALVFTSDAPALLSTPEETFVIVVTPKEVRWARSALGTEALKREVAALRCGLDEEEWATVTKQRHCANLLGIADMPDDRAPLPFQLGRAHNLYKALLGPFEQLIADKRLLIVPSGPLTSLPFSVLVTAEPRHALPRTFEEYFDVTWLGTRNALVTLPAVSSLASLREQLAAHPRAPAQYAGYGNPVLVGGGGDCRPTKSPATCPSSEAAGMASGVERATIRGRGGRRSGEANIDRMYASGAWSAAVLDQVRALCPLPDTEYEIRCVAQRFKENDRLLRLQADAKELDIKALSQRGELARYRILHFATHGLLSGDVQQITNRQGEPALVLTPPDTPLSPDDEGLLTASEVTALKLNADWVVLSACNTAAGDKIGAEALSGLARSFFYAGARSLLVSHWPVYSDAAVRLAAHAFAELDRDPNAGRAEALRRAVAALIKDRSLASNAHPAVWAPFVVVGEGGPQQYATSPVLLERPTAVAPGKSQTNN